MGCIHQTQIEPSAHCAILSTRAVVDRVVVKLQVLHATTNGDTGSGDKQRHNPGDWRRLKTGFNKLHVIEIVARQRTGQDQKQFRDALGESLTEVPENNSVKAVDVNKVHASVYDQVHRDR